VIGRIVPTGSPLRLRMPRRRDQPTPVKGGLIYLPSRMVKCVVSLDSGGVALREKVVPPLLAHAAALEAYALLSADLPQASEEGVRALSKAEGDLAVTLRDSRRACLHHQALAIQEGTTTEDARSVVVTVRPKWSGKLKELAGDGGFGSGFVVRARDRGGKLQTFVVTNRHVMEGALEADIVAADAYVSTSAAAKASAIGATLVMLDPNDDVAVLRFNDDVSTRFATSVRFRATPVKEQEGVVAAGFPAVGNKPSFQVTKGVVSNAHFDGSDEDVGISYLQHTAPIDAGNSGGPLLDDHGRVIGINTAKLRGRENTNLAIPTTRVLASLARLAKAPGFNSHHAQASCDGALAALAAAVPAIAWTSRFSREIYENEDATAASSPDATLFARVNYRASVHGVPDNPLAEARLRGYELVRRRVDAEGGVAPFARCAPQSGRDGNDVMTFRTRGGVIHTVQLAEEAGQVRVHSLW
jgi:S1-C subfamily serine protease